jgi:hypothetical protein
MDDTDCSCPDGGLYTRCGFDPVVAHFVCFQQMCAG